jgi:hypothetical protein
MVGADTWGPRGGEGERGRRWASDTWPNWAWVAVTGWRVGSSGLVRKNMISDFPLIFSINAEMRNKLKEIDRGLIKM